nr:uncharacterized protein LOC129266142 [Lytechinus pictus]
MDYDPVDRKVYWRNSDAVVRISVDTTETPPVVEPYLRGTISSFSIDAVRRHFYFTDSDPARDGKIYYRMHLYSTAPIRNLLQLPTNYLRLRVEVDSITGFLYYTSPMSNMLGVYDISARTTKVLQPFYAQAFVFETCLTSGSTPPSSRLYYYKDSEVLGYTDTLNNEIRTLGTMPGRYLSRLDLAKYGSKLFFIRITSGSNKLVEYDTMSSSLEVYDDIQISYSVANISMNQRINPTSIRIINDNYTEAVSIVDCPMDFSVPIASNSTNGTQQVSWTEPSLNAWSNCATLEFLGPATNGGNFSEGVYNISYEASDLKGDTDTCNFMLTVGDVADDASTTDSSSTSPQSGTTPEENPPSGGGAKASCTFVHLVFSVALLITLFN